MKKSILLCSIFLSLFSCQKTDIAVEQVPAAKPAAIEVPDPIIIAPTIAANSLIGNWYITKIFNFASPKGKAPKNATITVPKFSSFLVMEANSKASLSKIGISNYGFDPFTQDSYIASYSIDKDILKLTVTISSRKYINYFKVKSVNEKEMVLFQDKPLYLKALEENKLIVGDKSYKEDLAVYNDNDRYESEITLLK
jgi:hypothetical protein